MNKYIIVLLSFFALTAYAFTPKKIFIIHSYDHKNFAWTKSITQGLVQGLNKNNLQRRVDYILVEETMDVFKNQSTEALKKRAQVITEKIKREKPDLIITTDDDALIYVGLDIDNTPVVFCGVNKTLDYYLQHKNIDSIIRPNHNITGIYQTTYIEQTMDLLKKLSPKSESFALITDSSTTGLEVLSQFSQHKNLALTLQDTLVSNDFLQWQHSIKSWNKYVDNIVIIAANLLKDHQGNSMKSQDALNWINMNSALPSASFWDFTVSEGALVSAADTGNQQGWHSAEYVYQILRGKSAGELPIITPDSGVPTINVSRLAALGIELSAETTSIFVFSGKAY